MPGHDGLWLAEQLRREHPHTAVILATGFTSLIDPNHPAPPVADLLIKPFARERFVLAMDRGRQWRREALEDVRWHAQLALELRDRTDSICAEVTLQANAGASEADVLVAMSNAHMPETMAHAERVARFARSVARELALDGETTSLLESAARFHDIGKLAIPASLLDKPSPLTPGEEALVRRHAEVGAGILAACRTLSHLAPLVLASHEWFGGGGYPRKLAAQAIPLCSRIIGVIDTYDAMTQNRQYRNGLDSTDAVSELLRCRHTQFDSEIVAVFLAVLGRH
jgi:HD-GYP domain-containing protein (c-di-GMP phosphodiesterase class II)